MVTGQQTPQPSVDFRSLDNGVYSEAVDHNQTLTRATLQWRPPTPRSQTMRVQCFVPIYLVHRISATKLMFGIM